MTLALVALEEEGHGRDESSSFSTWEASLSLAFTRGAQGTRLARAEHFGPLRVQRAFHPEGADGSCHVYVLHPPGGIVGGDTLALTVDVADGAGALLTMPGANKLYRARPGTVARLDQRFSVAGRGLCEWLPQETIVFDGAHATSRTEVALSADARFAGWEIVCLGRPAAGERFTRGALRTELSVRRADRLIYLERARYLGGDAMLDAPWGLSGQPVLGTFVVASPELSDTWVGALREALGADDAEGCRFAVTAVSGVLVVRVLGASTRAARRLFERAFAVLRPLYAGRPAVPPRIWST
ncbi:MAG: urease accessory protein UreD [Polyangiales bacterium]